MYQTRSLINESTIEHLNFSNMLHGKGQANEIYFRHHKDDDPRLLGIFTQFNWCKPLLTVTFILPEINKIYLGYHEKPILDSEHAFSAMQISMDESGHNLKIGKLRETFDESLQLEENVVLCAMYKQIILNEHLDHIVYKKLETQITSKNW